MSGKGGGGSSAAADGDAQANGGGQASFQRGLDSGLAKAAPSADKLDSKSYRSYRRRLLLFSKQCSRRGSNVAVEGASLTLSLLQDSAWEAAEQLNIDDIEADSDAFRPILMLSDRLYQYEEHVELPSRCEEFQEFSRMKGEEMQAYFIRHATFRKKMLEVKVEVPDLLAGWHLLARAGVPKWTHLQVKSLYGGVLSYQKVAQALLKMFGGDHKPNTSPMRKISSAAPVATRVPMWSTSTTTPTSATRPTITRTTSGGTTMRTTRTTTRSTNPLRMKTPRRSSKPKRWRMLTSTTSTLGRR